MTATPATARVSPGLAQLRKSPKAAAVRKATLADQRSLGTAAARPGSMKELTQPMAFCTWSPRRGALVGRHNRELCSKPRMET